jgi:hypothetical protein
VKVTAALISGFRSISFGEVRHDGVEQHQPRRHVKSAGDQRDQQPDVEAAAERDGASQHVVAVGTNPEIHEQHRDDDGRVADDQHAIEDDSFGKRHRRVHQHHRQRAGQQPKGENGFFHVAVSP